MVARLTHDLDSSVKESKALHLLCQDLQREVDHHKAAANQTKGISRQVEEFEAEVKAIASLLADRGRRLEGLADTCRDVASMLKSLDRAK